MTIEPMTTADNDCTNAPSAETCAPPAEPCDLTPEHGLLGFILLVALAASVCLFGLQGGPPLGDHECIHAQCARQALQGGEWLIPHFNDVPRINKPPLGTWLIILSSLLVDARDLTLPVSDFAARLPQSIAGLLMYLEHRRGQ